MGIERENAHKFLNSSGVKIKVLLLSFNFPPSTGGIEDYLYNICVNLCYYIVLAPKMCQDEHFDRRQKFKIYRHQLLYNLVIRYSLLYRLILFPMQFLFIYWGYKIIKREKVTFIQSGNADFCFAAWCLSILTRKPFSVFTYGNDIVVRRNSIFSRLWKKGMVSFILRRANAVICISNFSKKKVEELGVNPLNIAVINPGVKEHVFYPNYKMSLPIIKKYSLDDKKVILSVGRLVRRKGHDKIIEALPLVLKRIANVIYLIIGSGPEEQRLKKLAKNYNLEENVIFVGYVSEKELVRYYNACEIFVMPSRELEGDVEGFGIVYLEANACGKPVIGGKSGGTLDAVIHGITGFLVDPVDEDEISEKIIKLLSSPSLAERLGKQGLQRIKAEFSTENTAHKVKDLMIKIMEKN